MGKALILTNGKFDSLDAKTAHGLIRGTKRFKILGVIDHLSAGKDAGSILDGRERGLPIYASLREFSERSDEKADYAIIGVAVTGGRLTEDWNQLLLDALENRLSIVSGMHRLLSENPLLKEAAERNGVRILDIRRPKPTSELQFWTGEIYKVKAPILAVLGTDCAIGKRTTCRILLEMCREAGIKAEMCQPAFSRSEKANFGDSDAGCRWFFRTPTRPWIRATLSFAASPKSSGSRT